MQESAIAKQPKRKHARAYASGTQRYARLEPWSAQEEIDLAAYRVAEAVKQLQRALDNDPASVRTFAYAVCSRQAEYELVKATLTPQRQAT